MLIEKDRAYLSPDTIARELDVSDQTVRRWIREGELPVVHIEKFTRIPIEGFQAFLRRKIAVTDPQVA